MRLALSARCSDRETSNFNSVIDSAGIESSNHLGDTQPELFG